MASTLFRICYLMALIVTVRSQACEELDIVTELRIIEGSSLPTPIAISARTFLDVLKNGNIYIDKSLWVNQIFREKWDSTCPIYTFARPTGMGKSVMMDMVRIFAEAKIDLKTDEVLPRNQTLGYRIFQLGEIPMGDGKVRKLNRPPLISELSDVMEDHQGQYIVLFANFSDLKPSNIQEVKRGIGYRIHQTIKKFDFDRIDDKIDSGSSDSTTKEIADSFLTDDWKWSSFARIWMALKEYFRRDVVIMIDAFDEPMVSILVGPSANLTEVVDPVINFYEEAYYLIDRYNATFKRFIMTSTIRMGFEDMYSNYDLFNEMMGEIVYHSFGFKQNEVDAICDHIGIPKSISSKLKYHYGGYYTSSNEENTFNPTSIAKFAFRRKIENFWKPRSTFEQLFDIFLEIPEFRKFMHNVTLDLCGTKGPYTVHDLIITCTSEGFLQQLSLFLEDNNNVYRDQALKDDILLAAKCMCRSAGILSRLNEIPNEEVEMYVRAKLLACGP